MGTMPMPIDSNIHNMAAHLAEMVVNDYQVDQPLRR